MSGTHIDFNSKEEHTELKRRALDLGIDLRELLINGARCYKPKKGMPKGMELYMDSGNDIPEDFYNKKQWKKHCEEIGKNKKLDEMIYWLAGLRKI